MVSDGCFVCGACCTTCCVGSFAIVGLAVWGAFEIAISPISIPCSIWRRRKYNRWLKKWSSNLSEEDKALVQDYCDGEISYTSFNRKFKQIKLEVLSENGVRGRIPAELKLIPIDLLNAARMPWNCTPSKTNFIGSMETFLRKLRKIKFREQPANVANIDASRLKELLIESVKNCSICLEPLKSENSVVSPCQHIFHTNCLSTWTSKNNRCPECRKAFDDYGM